MTEVSLALVLEPLTSSPAIGGQLRFQVLYHHGTLNQSLRSSKPYRVFGLIPRRPEKL